MRPNRLGAIVASIVANHVDRHRLWMPLLELFQQGDGRDGIDAVVEAHHRLEALEVNRAVDVDPSPPGVGADLAILATLDPALGDDRIVLRVDRIHEIDGVLDALGLLELFVLGQKGLLRLGIGLTRDELGLLLVDVAQTVQQRCHAADGVGDVKGIFDPLGDGLGGEIEVALQVRLQARQLRGVELAGATTERHMPQRFQAILAIALEMVAHRIRVDL